MNLYLFEKYFLGKNTARSFTATKYKKKKKIRPVYD